MKTIPFSISHSKLKGWPKTRHGLLHDEGEHLRLEFRVEDGLELVLPGVVQQVRIPVRELASVRFEPAWLLFSPKIILQANRLGMFESGPEGMSGRLELYVARDDGDAAQRFVAALHDPAPADDPARPRLELKDERIQAAGPAHRLR